MISKTRLGGLDLWIPSKYKKLGSKAEVGFMTSVPLHLRFFRDIGVGGVDSLPFLLSRAPGSWSPVQWMGSVLLSAFVPPTCVVWAQDITKAWGRTTSQRSWSQLALTIYIGDIKFSHIWSRKDELLGSGIALVQDSHSLVQIICWIRHASMGILLLIRSRKTVHSSSCSQSPCRLAVVVV